MGIVHTSTCQLACSSVIANIRATCLLSMHRPAATSSYNLIKRARTRSRNARMLPSAGRSSSLSGTSEWRC